MSFQSTPAPAGQTSANQLACNPDNHRFDTAHLKDDIKGRSLRGGVIIIGSQGIKFILQTGSTAVLARLLTPADFGLIAMVSAFTEFVNIFKNLGLSMATIQKKEITHEQVSSMFWINVALSCLLVLVAAAISPLVARFYGEPRLTLLTIAIGCTFIFGGLIAQHTALMQRQMRFHVLAATEIASLAAGIAAAVVAALSGLSYWSLVIMVAVRGLANVTLVWSLSDWRPGRPAVSSGIRSILAFGGNLTGSNLLEYFTRNGDNIIIGRALGSASLGIYSKAYGILMLPMSQINSPLDSIMLPALSRLQDEPDRYRRFYLQALATVATITMPLVAFMFVSADEIVHVLLGDQWSAVATTFRWLAPAAFLGAVNFAPNWLFITLGRAQAKFRWTLICSPVIVAGFLVGVQWGINGVAASVSITWSAMFLLAVYWAALDSPVRFCDCLGVLAVPALSSLLAAFGTAVVGNAIAEFTTLIRLVVLFVTFVAMYLTCLMATPKGRSLVRSTLAAVFALKG